MRKGIILAGGEGTRLFPSTMHISKHLLPIYDKPMIFYAISVLIMANIKDILIITKQKDIKLYKDIFSDGSQYGVKISYEIQNKAAGIAEAFLIGEKFLSGEKSLLILGDNLFYGDGLEKKLSIASKKKGATIFIHPVFNPNEYGIAQIKNNKIINIVEKPKIPKSRMAVTGIYFFDENATKYARNLKPSKRGELEITDLNNLYLKKHSLNYQVLGRGYAWFDAGTHQGLLDASQFVKVMQERQGHLISCIEEISLKKKLITKKDLREKIKIYKNSSYGQYIKSILN